VAAEAPATELTPGQKLVQFGEAIQTMQAVDVPQPGQLAPELRQLQENMPAPVAGVDVPLPVAEETEAYKVALAAQDARAAATAALAAEEAKGLPVGTAGAAPAQLTDAQVGMEGKTDVVLEAGLAPSRAVLRVAVSRAFVSQTAAEAAVGVETVNMTFPRTVYLTLPDRSQIVFQAGVQPVPVDLSTHSYLVANGVTLVTPNPTRVLDPVLPGASTTAALDSRIAKK
jgi:hypothetical protein